MSAIQAGHKDIRGSQRHLERLRTTAISDVGDFVTGSTELLHMWKSLTPRLSNAQKNGVKWVLVRPGIGRH